MIGSRAPIWAYLLLVFAGGGVVGVFADRLYTVKGVSADSRAQPRTPDEYRQKYVEELKTRLKLDAVQVAKLNAVLESTQERMHQLHEREKPEMTAIHQEQVDRVHEILNDKQDVEYDKMREERENAAPPNGTKRLRCGLAYARGLLPLLLENEYSEHRFR